MRLTLPILALALALSACGGKTKQQGAGTAEGEVLPGSVSDAMLPYDSVKSQAPLAPQTEGGGKGAAKTADQETGDGAGTGAATPAADANPAAAASSSTAP